MARLQVRVAELQGIVVHHERAKGRHHLHHAGNGGGLELLRQRQHQRAQACIDAIAELHHQRGVAGGQKFCALRKVIGGGQCGT